MSFMFLGNESGKKLEKFEKNAFYSNFAISDWQSWSQSSLYSIPAWPFTQFQVTLRPALRLSNCTQRS